MFDGNILVFYWTKNILKKTCKETEKCFLPNNLWTVSVLEGTADRKLEWIMHSLSVPICEVLSAPKPLDRPF
jgi:hypothetical protein